MGQDAFIQFNDITKRFPGVKALSDVSFSIKKGEIHALCGENGAGKTTLINICSGVIHPNQGDLIINGEKVKFDSPKDAERYKIATVHQEVPLCDNLTIAENIFLGPNPKAKFGFVDRNFMNAETIELLALFQLSYLPTTLIQDLTLAEQSMIQFLRAIHTEPDFLILDEPTASLPAEKKDLLFSFLQKKREEKEITVLYISHKLEEVFEIAERISVLRDGSFVGTLESSQANINDVINMMVGRDIEKYIYEKNENNGDIAFEVRKLSRKHVLEDINFDIKKGEILGFAGLQGAGRTEMARIIFGIDKADAAEIFINGRLTKIKNVKHAIKNGIAMIPEDRRNEGIVPEMSVANNLIMVALKKVSTLNYFINKRKNKLIKKYTDNFKIKSYGAQQLISQLSGGNQQKVIISRWLASEPSLLICDEPTRGIDVNSKSEIQSILVELAKEGIAVILISSELPDLLAICDRIIVMRGGKITGQVMHADATEEKIMYLATAA
jgi:ribose transport system ATP-binding protein